MSAFLPVGKPLIGKEEKEEVLKVLDSGWISVGPECKRLEELASKYLGVDAAVTVSSCTAGLFLSLKAIGVGPGDEVVVPTYTFCSSVNVVEHLGARPVLIDSEPNTMNLDIMKLKDAITEKTRAIVPVHFAGQPVDIDKVLKIAGDVPVIEDAAHAIGAEFGHKKIGGFGLATNFSFYATKNMTTGDGGMVTTNSEPLAEKLKLLRLHGLSRDAWKRYTSAGSWKYDVVEAGYKANLTDMQAALGVIQLGKLEGFIERRRELAGHYRKLLGDLEIFELPEEKQGRKHVFHLFPVFVKKGIDRDKFIEGLRSENIGTSVHFIPVHSFTYYKRRYGFSNEDFPVAWNYSNREISLPIFNGMSLEDVERVVAAVKKIGKNYL
ncbi:DegT/DnrJ/EryC1/StrS aminotransferase family protein [Candidatus Bathyarchaeota archaeon]|nr:DegT/DnrJ/EryC1/StrS aminotransferase family protein [Candidatus Bathyarchaeota archaeon]